MRKVKISTIILAIILITLIAFGGVYVKTQNRMENKVKDYSFGRELSGERVVEVKVATEDDSEENSEQNTENLTEENYETVKKTIEKRLKVFGQDDYTISVNYENGTIMVELPEDANTDTYVYLLTASATVQITEKDTETELLSDSMVKKAYYTYTADSEGKYQVYLELYLTKDGQAKIEEIKNNYAILADEVAEIEETEHDHEHDETETVEGEETTENAEENSETAEETKKIAVLKIADTEYDINSIEKDKIKVKIGSQTTNTATLNNNAAAAAELATLISAGKYPIKYEIGENKFVYSDITEKDISYFATIAIGIIVLMAIVFTISYKGKGLLVGISMVGFTSTLLLILRYANVSVSVDGIAALILIAEIDIRISQLILYEGRNIDYKNIFLDLVPVIIISLVFCFAEWASLSSFGLIMFWGLLLIVLYNMTVTKTLLKLKESK